MRPAAVGSAGVRSAGMRSSGVRSLVGRGAAPSRSERGSVTAEFAAVIPAVVLVLAFCLVGVQVTGQQVRLQDAATDAARILGRGEATVVATDFVTATVPGATLTAESRNGAVCVFLQIPIAVPGASVLALTNNASSCALDGGR